MHEVSDRRLSDGQRPPTAGRWQAVGGLIALGLIVFGAVAILDPLRSPALAGVAQTTQAPTPSGGVVISGRGLYTAQCSSCHGPQGEGGPNGPSLVGAGAAGADFYMRTGRMPLSAPGQPVTRNKPRLSNEEIAAIVEVVASFGPGPQIPQVLGGGDIGDGARLYIANCAACHGATGAGNAIGGGSIAANLGLATHIDIVEAIRIGPGAMPEFRFSEEDEAAIVAYIDSMRSSPEPGGTAIGGLGAVAEGFIAIAVGLVLLVLAAMFVGRRSHEGEPPTTPFG